MASTFPPGVSDATSKPTVQLPDTVADVNGPAVLAGIMRHRGYRRVPRRASRPRP